MQPLSITRPGARKRHPPFRIGTKWSVTLLLYHIPEDLSMIWSKNSAYRRVETDKDTDTAEEAKLPAAAANNNVHIRLSDK